MKNSFYFVFGLMIAALLMLPYLSNGAEKAKSSSAASSGSRKITLKAQSLKKTLKSSVSDGKINIPDVKAKLPDIKSKLPKAKVPSSSTSIK